MTVARRGALRASHVWERDRNWHGSGIKRVVYRPRTLPEFVVAGAKSSGTPGSSHGCEHCDERGTGTLVGEEGNAASSSVGAVCGASPAILGAPPPPMPADSRAELAALKARAEMLSAMIASKKSQLHGQGSPCTEAFMLTRFEEAPIMETRVPESSDTEAPVTDAPASEAAGDGQEAASEAAVSARACPECGKQCFTGNSLRAHLRRQHAPADKRPEVLPCLLCDSVLQLQCLEKHERECHWPAEESFWCHRCLTRFGAAADLFWHVRSLCSLT